MVLAALSDMTYLNETRARSRSGSHIFCSDNDPITLYTGPVLYLAQIINLIMSSASEAELVGLFITAVTRGAHKGNTKLSLVEL